MTEHCFTYKNGEWEECTKLNEGRKLAALPLVSNFGKAYCGTVNVIAAASEEGQDG